nr:MAG TPA: hypothetical protein [Caudoviricetes sp.]
MIGSSKTSMFSYHLYPQSLRSNLFLVFLFNKIIIFY